MRHLAICLLLSVVSVARGEVLLVRDGQPCASVVLPAEPLAVERYAAEELVEHIRLASGCRLPVVTAAPAGPRLLLGRAAGAPAEAEPNAFRLTVRGESIFIAGRDDPGEPLRDDVSAGTLFGVYELLERVLGVRWLWPGELGTHVPAAANLVVPELDLVLAPALRHTRLRFGGLMSAEAGWSNPAAREKFIHDQLVWLRRHRLARGISLEYGHGFETWYERHAATHPEYFNLLPDGTRRSDPMYHGGEDRLISLSVAEPGVVTERIKEWSQQRTAQRPWVNGAENDTCGKCVCELCLAWDGEPATPAALARAKAAFAAGDPDWWKELGSVSDRYARFWMALQTEAQKTDPGATVLGYAYANYHEPPLRTRLNERIVVAIVPRLMYPWTAAKREAFRAQWAGWSAAGARLYLRPNYTLDGHAFPIWYADQLAEDFNFVHANGLIATDFDSLTSSFGAQGPTLYTLARLQQHPDWPAERILAEWYGAFGPAEAAVRAYGDLWRRVSAQVDDQTLKAVLQRTPDGGSWGRFYLIADGIFTPAVMAEAERLLAAARQAAAGQPTALRRVEFLEQGLRQAALCLQVERARRAYTAGGELTDYQEALQALDTFRAETEDENLFNPAFLRYLERPVWDRDLLTVLRQPGEKLPGPWRFRFDPEAAGEAAGWMRPDHDDRDWSETGLSTAWEQQPVGQAWQREHGHGYDGVAWYRTSFNLAAPPEGRLTLVFGAVDESCVIWLNGVKLLERVYDAQKNPDSWREAFEVDITQQARVGANQLAVRVEDNSGAGGIWRPVWLVRHEPSSAANLLPDGGFEAGPGAWRQHLAGGEVRFALDQTVAHGGAASARLEGVSGGEKIWGRWYQAAIPLQPGKRYRLRAWVRTSADFSGSAEVWWRAADGGLGAANRNARIPATNGLWQEVRFDGIVPSQATGALYLNLMRGTGTVWFDDVELTEEGP